MMLDRVRQKNVQRGIGLLELMLALAIIAVLLIMATRYYQSTSQAQKVNQAASDIQAILAATANYRAGNPTGAFTIASLKGFLPQSWGDASKANPWGGGYTAKEGTKDSYAIIGATGIPTTACEALSALTKVNTTDPTGTTSNCNGQTFSAEFGVKIQ